MASPSVKNLPKADDILKTQLENFSQSKLKDVETQEKLVLPTAEDIANEKQRQQFLDGVKNFPKDKLKRTETQEKTVWPTAQDLMAVPSVKDLPKVDNNLKTQLENFSQSKLKDVETQEKLVLPTAEDITSEKQRQQFLDGVTNFPKDKLKRTETQEKIVLPTPQ
ncbi:hypothetical protein QYM36_006467, partial [Artemia franciscana]